MIYIIDASVAIKWFVEEEKGYKEALALLESIKNDPSLYAVPELFFNEMLAVFCRLIEEASLIREYIEILEDLGLNRLGNGRKVLSLAAEYAKKYQLTGYDAVYVANAKLVDGIWLTADKKAYERLKSSGLSQLL